MNVFANVDKLVRPAIDAKTNSATKKRQIMKNTIQMMAAMSGVYITRHTATEMIRILGPSTDENDPLKIALQNLTLIFSACANSGVNIARSVDELIALHKEDRKNDCMLFLAWKTTQKTKKLELVGAATCCNFVSSEHISTLESNLGVDYAALSGYFTTPRTRGYYYMDTLCSKSKGVGRILTLYAFDIVQRKKKAGLIALAYSHNKRDATPKSLRMFQTLSFTTLWDKNSALTVTDDGGDTYDVFGRWVVKEASDFEGIDGNMMALCTRGGLTDKTKRTLMWRCPG